MFIRRLIHPSCSFFRNPLVAPSCGGLVVNSVPSSSGVRFYTASKYTMKKDYYKTLGVPKSATKDQIKKSFRTLAMKYHPDLNKDDKAAENKFKDISEAYEVLEDDKKRQQYDAFGHDGVDLSGNGGGMDPNNPFAGFAGFDFSGMQGNEQFVNVNMNGANERIIFEIFNMHFANDGFEGDIFNGGNGKNRRRKNRSNDFFEDMGFSFFDFDEVKKKKRSKKSNSAKKKR